MKRNQGFSLFGWRRAGAPATDRTPATPPQSTTIPPLPTAPERPLSGSELEQAYRGLLLENMVLAESNERLHERLARQENGLEESPAARQLIQAQRNALAERAHRMRELEYHNKQLLREQKKLLEENRRLAATVERQLRDLEPLRRQNEASRRELADARAVLREKSNELFALTERYYQLEARLKRQLPTTPAANGDF